MEKLTYISTKLKSTSTKYNFLNNDKLLCVRIPTKLHNDLYEIYDRTYFKSYVSFSDFIRFILAEYLEAL